MKQKNKANKNLKSHCISLKKFLGTYCGMNIECLNNLKMSHRDIKQLIPNLKRISFEDAYNNIRGLYVGEIIIVKDYCGDIAPYICPKLEEQLNFENPVYEKDKLENIEDLILNDNLNINQLTIIRNKLKAYKRFKEYRLANKLLKSKVDYKVKKYKREKKELIRESEKYEY